MVIDYLGIFHEFQRSQPSNGWLEAFFLIKSAFFMNILSADRKFLKVRIPRSLDEYLISCQYIPEVRIPRSLDEYLIS